jgi:hypothetical protein
MVTLPRQEPAKPHLGTLLTLRGAESAFVAPNGLSAARADIGMLTSMEVANKMPAHANEKGNVIAISSGEYHPKLR